MSLTSRLLGLGGTRDALPDTVTRNPTAATGNAGWSTPGMPQTPRWDATNAVSLGYYGHVYAYRCARTIATTIAGLPFRAGRDADRPGQFDVNAPLARLLGPPPGGPAPNISPRRMWAWSIVNYLVCGRYGWETTADPRSGQVTSLWPLVAGRLKPIPTLNGVDWFSGFEYQLNANIRRLRPDQVFYAWRPSQDDWREPESVLQAASLPLSTAIALDKHMYAFMRNNMVGSKLVVTAGFEDNDMRRSFQDQFLAEMTGWDNAGRTAFAEYDDSVGDGKVPSVQVVDLGTKPVDAQTIEQVRELKRDICVAFGVPVSMLGDASDRTYENADQEHRNYWTGTILPLLHELADDVNMTLAPRIGAEVGWFDISKVEALRPSRRFQDADPVSLEQAGFIGASEWREDVGLTPTPPTAGSPSQPEPEPAVDDTPGAGNAPRTRGYDLTTRVHAYLAQNYPERVLDWVDDATWRLDPAVPLSRIKMARRPGARDQDKVDAIAEAIKAGKTMEPVVLVDTGEAQLEIADGYHRTMAFDRAGRKTIRAYVATGAGRHGPWEQDMHAAKLNRSAADLEETPALWEAVGDALGWESPPFGGSRFDANEPRDPHGQWSKVGGALHKLAKVLEHDTALSNDDAAALRTGSAAQHLVTAADGSVHFTPERAALHARIIDEMLAGHAAQEHPRYHLMGGGPASGKSTMMDAMASETGDAAIINADEVKTRLPEYASHGTTGAVFTHEESSYVAKQAIAEGFRRRVNVTLDGTGDSSAESLGRKVARARAAGYSVHGYYVTVPTEVAVQRAEKRAARTGRHVPRTVIEETHANVSTVLPLMLDQFDDVHVYDNTTELTEILRKYAGKAPQVISRDLWEAFLAKGRGGRS